MFIDHVDIVPFVECPCLGIVEFIVEDCSTPIFHSIFKCCDNEDYNDRDSAKTRI